MQSAAPPEWFSHHVRVALVSLYDPSALRASPLITLFGLDQRSDPVGALRRTLTDGIELLRPGANTPPGVKARRVYQILRRRYTEQVSQPQVAADLSLSVRQLQRDESLARRVLAEHLWASCGLATNALQSESTGPETTPQPEAMLAPEPAVILTRTHELSKLSESVPLTLTDVSAVASSALNTVTPLARATGVTLDHSAPRQLRACALRELMLRQALVHTLGAAIRCVPGGEVGVRMHQTRLLNGDAVVTIIVQAETSSGIPVAVPPNCAESLNVAKQLVALCPGSLQLSLPSFASPALTVDICLTAVQGAQVLVIDDNTDVLKLFQRYLSHTRYAFFGSQNAEDALSSAIAVKPDIILLDVMMPGRDGWMLLTSLRENPSTRDIPVIVCTVLAEEELAYTLGAVGFLPKPVSRPDLLRALDRHCRPNAGPEPPTASR